MNRKTQLRKIVLDIILNRETVFYEPSQFAHLTAGVAEVLHRQSTQPDAYSASVCPSEKRLDENDWKLVQEIFLDLVIERVINIGMNESNPTFPWFRLHSDANKNLKTTE